MKNPAHTLLLLITVLLAPPGSLAVADDGKWIDLLPGNKLDKHWTSTGNWSIDKDGVVQLQPRPGERGWKRYDAYLWLKDMKLDDFEFQFEYKLAPRGNSGFYFNVGDMKSPVAKGIEVQIYDSAKKGGKKLNDHDSGGVIPGVAPKKNAAKPAGEWNKFHIIVKGDTLTVNLNGVEVNKVDLTQGRLKDRPKSGYIGFQDHGLPLWLRGMRVKKL